MQLVYLGKLEYLLLRSPLFDRDFFLSIARIETIQLLYRFQGCLFVFKTFLGLVLKRKAISA